jgi:hypothetical protein
LTGLRAAGIIAGAERDEPETALNKAGASQPFVCFMDFAARSPLN